MAAIKLRLHLIQILQIYTFLNNISEELNGSITLIKLVVAECVWSVCAVGKLKSKVINR